MKTKINKNCYSKLYKHIFKKFLKKKKPCSCIKSESQDCHKKHDKDIISASGHDICNHLTRYETYEYYSNNWKRRQI